MRCRGNCRQYAGDAEETAGRVYIENADLIYRNGPVAFFVTVFLLCCDNAQFVLVTRF
jgi:hypothetical protein